MQNSYLGRLTRQCVAVLVLPFILMACLVATGQRAAAAPPLQKAPLRVLLVTGDWKSQAWYQDVVMGGKQLYRGRYIIRKVNAAAPGRFQFTDITNYIGQEYIDANYLSQFDVVLIADMQGWSMPKSWYEALRGFVQNGGGLIYCASYKWHTLTPLGTGFDEALPTTFEPVNDLTGNWIDADYSAPDKKFQPILMAPNDPVVQGLAWQTAPPLDALFRVKPKAGAKVLLQAPSGAPVLVSWSYGKGRAITSPSIFANDEVSTDFGQNWPDFGKYYAQVFAWLGANSTARRPALVSRPAPVTVTVNYNTSLNPIKPGWFSFNSAIDPPNIGRLSGVALDNFNAINQRGGFSRINPSDFERERGQFNYASLDDKLAEFKRLGLEPEVVFDDVFHLPWIWTVKGTGYGNPTDAEVNDCADYVAAFLQHANHGKRGDAGYQPVVKYLEVGNEPSLSGKTIDGYVKIVHAVAARVHRDYPGVSVGAGGGYEIPYLYWFIDRAGADVDFIARHPYGHTGEGLFRQEDDFRAYAHAKGHDQIKFFITEWDYWIQGRPKFDYMMKRTFATVKRDDLIGTMHYRLDQYEEPVYQFGALWGFGGPGAGPKGTPMHDAYDSYWIFKDFRGTRVPVTKSLTAADMAGPMSGFLPHMLADGSRDGDVLSAVLYYDWAYDAGGYTDFARAVRYPVASVQARLLFPAATRDRILTISRATGEGFAIVNSGIKIPAGQTELTQSIDLEPLTAMSLTIR